MRSFRRFSRSALSSALTVTLSKKASTLGRSFAMARHGGLEIFLRDGGGRFGFGGVDGLRQRLFLGLSVKLWLRRAGVVVTVLLLLDAQDIGRALGAGEQALAVFGVEEFAERFDAADDQQEIVLAFEREHGIDQIVPRALLAELDFQAVGEEVQEVACQQ